jgi:hypothetical protein
MVVVASLTKWQAIAMKSEIMVVIAFLTQWLAIESALTASNQVGIENLGCCCVVIAKARDGVGSGNHACGCVVNALANDRVKFWNMVETASSTQWQTIELKMGISCLVME